MVVAMGMARAMAKGRAKRRSFEASRSGSRTFPRGESDHRDDDGAGQNHANSCAETIGIQHGDDEKQEKRGTPDALNGGESAGH
jgi:hypothetical protein